MKDFQNNYWAPLDCLDTVTPEGTLPDSDTLKENDLLFVRSNGNMELIGRCLLVGPVAEKITHSGFTIRARLINRGVMPKYLCYFWYPLTHAKSSTSLGSDRFRIFSTRTETGTQLVLTAATAPRYPFTHAKSSAKSTRRAGVPCAEPIGR
ncbi:MAG: hypothetical protein ACLP53_32165, partial [Isosphaeraceae bacterium]